MAKFYRIILQTYDERHPDTVEDEHQLLSHSLDVPTNCLNFGMGYEKQISLIQKVQDCVLEKNVYYFDMQDSHGYKWRTRVVNVVCNKIESVI